MRSEIQMLNMIIGLACADTRINEAVITGSKADRSIPKDIYQDYDIEFYVDDIRPFWNNVSWLENNFGRILLLQTPVLMDFENASPDNCQKFEYLAIFEDGNRVDLTITSAPFDKNRVEPFIVLVDKQRRLTDIAPDEFYYNVKPPKQKEFSDCCNEFWWCLNNVAKGIARDELPYAMQMFNTVVRKQLDRMVSWYIGTITDFSVSTGKMGRYFKKYLPESIYNKYLRSYAAPKSDKMWSAVIDTCKLFSDLARIVAQDMCLEYNEQEESGSRLYMMNVKDGLYARSL